MGITISRHDGAKRWLACGMLALAMSGALFLSASSAYADDVSSGSSSAAAAKSGEAADPATADGAASGEAADPSEAAEEQKWTRLWGETGLDTMSAIVEEGWTTCNTVVLTTFNGYWDALAGAGIAGFFDAPVLMTDPTALSPQTKALLEKYKPMTVLVCGGEKALPETVVKQALDALPTGAKSVRLSGTDAIGTANDIFSKLSEVSGGKATWSHTALIATNTSYHDALAAAPIAYSKHMPIMLIEGDSKIAVDTVNAMKNGGITDVIVLGGAKAVSPTIENLLYKEGFSITARLGGKTAIETSEAIAGYAMGALSMRVANMGVATVNGYWDALSGAASCGNYNSVMVLVDDENSDSVTSFIGNNRSSVEGGFVFGGEAAISKATYDAIVHGIDEPEKPVEPAKPAPGSWIVNTESSGTMMTSSQKDLFEKAAEKVDGVDYIPVAMVASQVVAGQNLAYLCKASTVSQYPRDYWAIVVVNDPLNGDVSIKQVNEISLGDIKTLASDSSNASSGWAVPGLNEGLALPDEAKAIFEEAPIAALGLEMNPIALLGTQSQNGTNYMIFCEGHAKGSTTGELYTVLINRNDQKIITLDSAKKLDLGYYTTAH